jgi:L-aminopeptidase/D-esterase-like protein
MSLLEPSGQGAASTVFRHIPIAVYTVVNAVGAVFDRQGAVSHGFLDPHDHRRLSLTEQLTRVAAGEELHVLGGNTTLTVVFVGQRLELYELDQLARQVHSSLARAIQPFHAAEDGDVLFAVSLPLVSNQRLPVSLLGAAVSEVAWHAVLACWPSAVAT